MNRQRRIKKTVFGLNFKPSPKIRFMLAMFLIVSGALCAFSNNVSTSMSIISLDTRTGIMSPVSNVPMWNQKVDRDKNTVTISYSIPYINMERIDGDKLVNCLLDGFCDSGNPFDPAVLYRYDSVELPDNYTIDISISKVESKEYDLDIPYCKESVTDSGIEPVGNLFPCKAETSGLYPAVPVCKDVVEKYRGHSIQYIKVYPVQYDSNRSKLRVISALEYKINYVQNSLESKESAFTSRRKVCNDETTINWLKENLTFYGFEDEANPSRPQYATGYEFEANAHPLYLIISHPSLESAVEKFATFKRLNGYRVQVEYNSNWTAESLYSYLYDEFFLPYVQLIFGDHSLVPGMKVTDKDYNDSCYTDLYYACMDSEDDKLPDCIYGRIPASNLSEANSFVNKLIEYDRNPTLEDSFYQNIGTCAYFQDVETQSDIKNGDFLMDGKEARHFVETMEGIVQTLSNIGLNPKRMYQKQGQQCNPKYYSDGTKLPDELTSNFDWNANTSTVINYINQGCSMLFYRGHGLKDKWVNNGVSLFSTENLNSLSNPNSPII